MIHTILYTLGILASFILGRYAFPYIDKRAKIVELHKDSEPATVVEPSLSLDEILQ